MSKSKAATKPQTSKTPQPATPSAAAVATPVAAQATQEATTAPATTAAVASTPVAEPITQAAVVEAGPKVLTMYEDLLRIAGALPVLKPGDDVQKHLVALTNAVFGAPEADWNSLQPASGQWYNDASASINAGTPIVPPVGFPEQPAAPAAAATSKPAKAPKAPKEPKPPKEKKVKPPKEPKKESTGISACIREDAILHGDWKPEAIKQDLLKRGFTEAEIKIGTVASIQSDVVRTVRMIKRLGLWNEAGVVEATAAVATATV